MEVNERARQCDLDFSSGTGVTISSSEVHEGQSFKVGKGGDQASAIFVKSRTSRGGLLGLLDG
jgi:hypothetical protein